MPHFLRAFALCLVGLGCSSTLSAAATAATPKAPSLPAEVCPVPDERPEVTYKANIDPKETAATDAWIKEAATLPGWKELLSSPDVETRQCANFLLVTMPASDRQKVPAAAITENIRLALAARHQFPWAQQVPWPIFLNDVLPYACLDEARDPWRADFLKRFGDMVKDAPTRDAAAKLINAKIQDEVGVKYSTRRRAANQSPPDSIRQGLASCSGLSILLCDAFRSVGIPARIAGVPTWVTVNGNHNWVEVWLGADGAPKPDSEVTPMHSLQWQAGWRVTEYNPDTKGWDHAWFMERAAAADPSKQETWIYASSWARTGLTFPMVWNLRSTQVHGLDRTAAYHALNGGRKVPVAPDKTHIALRAYRGDKRVAAEVTISQGTTTQSATTKGEDKDMNDVTRVEVPAAGGKVTVQCGEVIRTITPEAGKELTIELRLP